MVKNNKICRPTKEILERIANGHMKKVKLDCVMPIAPFFFPAMVALPATLKRIVDHFGLKKDDDDDYDDGGIKIFLGPRNVVKFETASHQEHYGRQVALTDFMDIARSIEGVAEDIRRDGELVKAAQRCAKNDDDDGGNLHLAVLAELYLIQPNLLYAYFVVRQCLRDESNSSAFLPRVKRATSNGVTMLTTQDQEGGDNTTETTLWVKTENICGGCCTLLLDILNVDVVFEVNKVIKLTCKSNNLDDRTIIESNKAYMIEKFNAKSPQ